MIDGKVLILSIGMISLSIIMPYFCYLDIRYRKIPVEYFYFLAGLNLPVMALIYLSGWVTLWHLATSLGISAMIIAAYLYFRSGIFSGADRNLLIAIILFLFYNPFSPIIDPVYSDWIAWCYQIKFIAYFFMVMCIVPGIILAYNLLKRNDYPLWDMLTKYPRGIPMVLPIAAAYYITVIWGI